MKSGEKKTRGANCEVESESPKRSDALGSRLRTKLRQTESKEMIVWRDYTAS